MMKRKKEKRIRIRKRKVQKKGAFIEKKRDRYPEQRRGEDVEKKLIVAVKEQREQGREHEEGRT
jgi:hypothetical protein